MKLIILVLILSLASCGPESSPEGRAQIRAEKLQLQVDSLKRQNQAILDTLNIINRELKKLNSTR